MSTKAYTIVFAVIAFVLQLAISDYLNMGVYSYICILPLLILLIPRQRDVKAVLLISFGLGFLLDLLSDGVLGLNAASAVMTAVLRKPFYKHIVNEDRQDKTEVPTVVNIGIRKYSLYLAVLIFVYMVTYTTLDGIGMRPASFVMIKIVVSTIINIALSILVSLSFIKRA